MVVKENPDRKKKSILQCHKTGKRLVIVPVKGIIHQNLNSISQQSVAINDIDLFSNFTFPRNKKEALN